MRGYHATDQNEIGAHAALLLMTVVILLVFAFGANGLNTDPIWTDELYAISNMGGFEPPFSPAEIVSSVADNFPDHVPLFFLLGAGWAHFVGWTQFALRLMPVLLGVIMIAWMYRLGSDIFGRLTGVVAATLLGTSAYVILYIHDFRMYSLFLMLAAAHFWLYWRLTHRKSIGRASLFIFVLLAIALFYTHMFSMILFLGLGLYHLLFGSRSRRWWQVVLAWGTGAVTFAPYIPVVLAGVQRASEKSDVTSRAASAPELLTTFLYLFGNGSWLIIALLIGAIVLVALRSRPVSIFKIMLIPLAMIMLIIVANELIGIIPLTRMRYFIVVWIPLVLIISACLRLVPRRRMVVLLLVIIWSVAAFGFYRSSEIMNHAGSMIFTRLYPPLQDYVYHLAGRVRSEDYLLGFTDSDYVNRDLKLGNSVADYYTRLHLGIDGAFIRRRADGESLASAIRQRIDEQPSLLFAFNPQNLAANHDKVFGSINADYSPCEVLVELPDLSIQRYVNSLLDCDRQPQSIEYVNGVRLVDRFAKYMPEEEIVFILTGWEVDNINVLDKYNLSLQFVSPDWQRMGPQVDRHLYDDILKWFTVDISTSDLPPGDYRVMVIVYDRDTVKKVSGVDLNTGREDDIFPILRFSVEA